MPLLITHGWPGSIVEFHKVIEPLTDPTQHGGDAADAFHVVAPSLPGFGFSGKPVDTGWGVQRIGDAFSQLMADLGYDRYVAQGGDWGSAVTTAIGGTDVDHCAAVHVTLAMGARPKLDGAPTPQEQRALDGLAFYQEWDSGYSKQQATRPQSIGYGLVDSPAAQAAWILEKFWAWTDCGGDPENVLTRDELLDNIMLYWINANGDVVGAHLLGELRARPSTEHRDDPIGVHRVSEGDRATGAGMGRGVLHRHSPLARAAPGRPFRGVRGSRPLCRRHPHLFPPVPLMAS